MKEQPLSLEPERQLITREFADTIAGKSPHPYLRTHDAVQNMLAERAASTKGQRLAKTAYLDRMLHFWREISLAGLARTGPGMDECYALLFESAFDLAQAEPDWAAECLSDIERSALPGGALVDIDRRISRTVTHASLREVIATIYAPLRERDPKWSSPHTVAAGGESWFWAGLLAAAGIDEHSSLWRLRSALANSSEEKWHDARLHSRLIREAPIHALTKPLGKLMAHPLIRLATLKYADGTVEQQLMVRFLNSQCIRVGIESEEDAFASPLRLAQWVRNARRWAEDLARDEAATFIGLLNEVGDPAVERCRTFFKGFGKEMLTSDSIDVTIALMEWANRMRGFSESSCRAELWEFVVHVVDAALWLGFLFPTKKSRRPRAANVR